MRYISNFSSGKQGHAIAGALASLGAETTLVSGPTREPDPAGVMTVHVESAMDMMAACDTALPVDVAVCAAAVSDWRVATRRDRKIKKNGRPAPTLELTGNPDILAALARHPRHRPNLVVGFAAETEDLVDNANAKRRRKACDWIVANDVSAEAGTFGASENTVHLITERGAEAWPTLGKDEVAERLGGGHRRTSGGRKAGGVNAVAVPVRRLPHARDLDLPEYATDGAAGLDLPAAIDSDLVLASGERRLVPHRHQHRPSAGHRGAGPAEIGPRARTGPHGAEQPRHDRSGLSRRDRGRSRQSGRRVGNRSAR